MSENNLTTAIAPPKRLQWLFSCKPFAFTETFTNFAYKYEDSISYEREESYEIEKTY